MKYFFQEKLISQFYHVILKCRKNVETSFPIERSRFKVNNQAIKIASVEFVPVSFLLKLNKYFATFFQGQTTDANALIISWLEQNGSHQQRH